MMRLYIMLYTYWTSLYNRLNSHTLPCLHRVCKSVCLTLSSLRILKLHFVSEFLFCCSCESLRVLDAFTRRFLGRTPLDHLCSGLHPSSHSTSWRWLCEIVCVRAQVLPRPLITFPPPLQMVHSRRSLQSDIPLPAFVSRSCLQLNLKLTRRYSKAIGRAPAYSRALRRIRHGISTAQRSEVVQRFIN